VTAFCCRHSKQLELNTSGTKVKRKDQLPQIDLPTTSIRTILAKVPPEEINMTVDQVNINNQGYSGQGRVSNFGI